MTCFNKVPLADFGKEHIGHNDKQQIKVEFERKGAKAKQVGKRKVGNRSANKKSGQAGQNQIF